MASIILIAIGASAIFYVIFIIYPACDLEFQQTEPRPVPDVPWNSTLLADLKIQRDDLHLIEESSLVEGYLVSYSKRPPDSESIEPFVVPFGTTFQLWVEFGYASSISGHWSGSNAQLVINDVTYFGETRSDSWGNSISGVWGGFYPYFCTSPLLSIDSAHYHKWIKADATMDIIFPALYGHGPEPGEGTFTNERMHLSLSFDLFAVSPEEYRTLEMHREWEQAYADKRSEWGLPLVVSGFFVFGGFFLLAASVSKSFRDSLK